MPVPPRPEGIQPRAWAVATAHLKDSDPVPTKVTVKAVSSTTECPDCDHDCKDCTCDDCECDKCN